MKILSIFFLCKIVGFHDWTSAAMEGKPPTMEQLSSGILGAKNYARMYCKRCGYDSPLNDRFPTR